jgi:hypothetical protein
MLRLMGMTFLLVIVLMSVTSCGTGTSRGYASLDGVRVADDGTRLTLVGLHGACDRVLPADVAESSREIRVSVPLDVEDGLCPAVGLSLEVVVTLDSPLAQRTVVDDRTGDPLPRLQQ